MALFESYTQLADPDQQSFLRRLQGLWQQSGAPEPLKLTPPSQNLTPPAPLPVATGNPDAPTPDLTDLDREFWMDFKAPQNRDMVSTAIGSGVISPTLHKIIQGAQSGDVSERFAFGELLRKLFDADYATSTCINARIDGATRLGITQEVIPAKGQEKNPVAIRSAERGNRCYQNATQLTSNDERAMTLREYILFGNAYDRLAHNAYGTVTDLMGLPPHTMKILVNSQLKLDDGQFVAYQQFDPYQWGEPRYQFPDVSILCIRNRMFRFDIYGTSFLLAIIRYIQDNIKTMDLVQRARAGGLPITVQQRKDAIGNSIHHSRLEQAQRDSLEQRIKRGEPIDEFYSEWINGEGSMTRLETGGAYWQGFTDNDVKYRASAIAGVLGRSLAMIITPEGVNRATAEWLTESDNDRENKLAMLFADTHDAGLMHKLVFATNVCAAAADPKDWGLEPGRYYIDPRLIQLKSDIVGQVTEDRAMERIKNAAAAKSAGTMSIKDAAFISAQSFRMDPDQYWQNLLRENPALQRAYPEDYKDPNANLLPPQLTSPSPDTDDEKVM